MRVFGYISEQESRHSGSGTPFLPGYNFHERHESGPIFAPADAILDAVAAYDMRSDPLSHAFMTLRELPGKLFPSTKTSREPQPAFGLHTFTPLERGPDTLSYGLTGRFWRTDMGIIPLRDVGEFTAFQQPGVARLVLHFQLVAEGEAWRLRTETFIGCPDKATRLKLLPYWLLIRTASGMIRRRTLSAIRHQLSGR
ncbi:hypothetical protein [Erwinia sp. SLM-02]|uniref:hypothetical protein n=1 Tax=Erwinia sp. SLM-02 TaxID=3020057 RepID=UPI0028D09FF8|nr:hypothetical protein [uncultured Erwinia sp.]